MKQGSASALGDMSYAYGYVARLSGTETATKGDRKMQNETIDMKGIQDGELTLIETRLKPVEGGRKSWWVKKEQIEGVVGGFTKKKFVLIGANENKEVKFQGLVSIIQDSETRLGECSEQVTEKDFGEESGSDVLKESREKFKESGMYVSPEKNLGNQGRVMFGNCRSSFFTARGIEKQGVVVLDELRKEDGKNRTGLLELNVPKGIDIAVGVGLKPKNKKEYVSPGVVIKRDFNDGRTLWVGMQEDGKIRYVGGGSNGPRERNQGWMTIHDWVGTETKYEEEDLLKKWNEEKGEKQGSDGKVMKIPLDKNRKYYLWDPSYTEIKKGKLKTKFLLKLSKQLLILLKIILDYKLCIYFSNCFLHTIPLYLEKK